MKKLNYLFAGLAVFALASCTNDEPNGQEPVKPEGDLAYMNIRIEPSGMGRSTTNGGYESSNDWFNANEHDVTDVKFYFFDENGVKAEVEANWSNPSFGANGSNNNIEFIGADNVLVLEGLKGNTYPTYMLTVLNLGTTWQCPGTLKEAAMQLQSVPTDGKFVMTTSSFFTTTESPTIVNHDDKFYYATKLEHDDFRLTAAEAKDSKPVKVYVERLAAKVSLTVSATETEDGSGIYPITETLGGGNNTGDENLDTQLFIKIKGWNVTATAKQSYLCKILQEGWKSDAKLNAWNWTNPTDRRSFFGEAATWGSKAVNGVNDKLYYINNAQTTAKKPGLPANKDGGIHAAYCYENTNLAENLKLDNTTAQLPSDVTTRYVANYPNTTYIVLDTEVGQMVGSEFVPVDLVTYRGLLYTKDSYMKYVLNKVQSAGKLNYYYSKKTETKDEEGNVTSTTYKMTQVDTSILTWVSSESGKYSEIKVVLDEAALKSGSEDGVLYTGETDADGNPVAYEDQAAAIKALADAILAEQTNTAIGHKDGRSLYNIAIEHLGASVTGATAADLGYYGVVRNHWYQINVNKFSKVGTGIFEPDNKEITVTPPTEPEPPLYYVGATINILSWKLVKQETEL